MAGEQRTAGAGLATLEDAARAATPSALEPREEIEREIRELLDRRAARAAAYGPSYAEVWEAASRCAQGGKLLRPRLLVDAFDALAAPELGGSERRESALRIAAAIEILHFSFLLHDDVIDEDLLRRGTPNLIGELLRRREAVDGDGSGRTPDGADGRLHWARSSGILVGDAMLSLVHQVFAREPLPHALRLRLLDLLDHTITESIVGECADVGLSDGIMPAELSAVLEMTRLKTATYTFELPLRAAAVLAGAAPRTETAIAAIARRFGVAFQLQDDLLSAFSSSDQHGKDPFSDFREGKETAIIAYARMTSAWPGIEPRFGAADFTDRDGAAIRAQLVACGAEEFIRSLVDEHLRAALELVSASDGALPPALVDRLLRLVESLEKRRF